MTEKSHALTVPCSPTAARQVPVDRFSPGPERDLNLSPILASLNEKESRERPEKRDWLIWATEAISEVIWICNSDVTKILYVSPSYERVWGRTTEQLYAHPWDFIEAIHCDDRERVLHDLEAIKSRLPFDQEYRIVRPDGDVRWIWNRGFPIVGWDQDPPYGGIAQDITDRKTAENALADSEEKFRHFFEEDLAGNYVATPDGRLMACNAEFVRMFGFASVQEAMAHNLAQMYPTPAARCCFLDSLQQQRKLAYHEKEMHRNDGRVLNVIENAIGTFNEKGELVEIQGHLIDDTERRLKDKALAKQAEQLARSNAELEQFAYVASHDLQEPLRMVSSYTQLLAKRYKGKLGPDADDFIAFAVDGAKRMQQLISDLLSYSRVTTRGAELRPTDSEAALSTALANLRMAIEESGAQIGRGPMPTVYADPGQLVRLFQNLVGNAIKFRTTAPPQIALEALDEGENWHFSVTDNGIGIDPRDAELIFQVFQRLHTQTEFPGTGIGLAICKKIVDRHDGRIWVESRVGAGATFHFTISKKAGGNQ